jgi:hypothetical protein
MDLLLEDRNECHGGGIMHDPTTSIRARSSRLRRVSVRQISEFAVFAIRFHFSKSTLRSSLSALTVCADRSIDQSSIKKRAAHNPSTDSLVSIMGFSLWNLFKVKRA